MSDALLWTEASAYARERRKWEATHTQYGPGERPFEFKEYPLMVYKAVRPSSGGPPRLEHEIAADANREAYWLSRGYVRGPDKAVEALEAQERSIAELAANRAYNDKRMSARAQEEAAKVDESTIQHLGEIPAQPIRKRQKLSDEERRRRAAERTRAYLAKKRAEKAQES